MCSWNRSYEEWLKNPSRRNWIQRDGAPYKLIGGTEGIYGDIPNLDQDAGGNNRFLVALELGYKEVEIRILPDIEPATINYWQTKGLEPTNVDHILGLY